MIVTFYSFKGGVGRSMALANVGWLLFRLGLRVTIVDWDLEAPGVDRFLVEAAAREIASSRGPRPESSSRAEMQLRDVLAHRTRSARGITDLLHQYRDRIDGLSLRGPMEQTHQLFEPGGVVRADQVIDSEILPSVRACLTTLISTPAGACIQFLGSGRNPRHREADTRRAADVETEPTSYGDDLRTINWADLYQVYGGELLFDRIASTLDESADIVLIDSRTGVTEMGGTCVLGLADMAVLMCYPNRQNLDGIIDVAEAIEAQNRLLGSPNAQSGIRSRTITWLPVLSRVDLSEPAQFEAFTAEFIRRSEAMLSDSQALLPPMGRVDSATDVTRSLPSARTPRGGSRRLGAAQQIRIPYDSRVSFEERVISQHKGLGGPALYTSMLEPYREIACEILAEDLARQGAKRSTSPCLPRCAAPASDAEAAAEVLWIMCASSEVEWAHLLAAKLCGSKGMRALFGNKPFQTLVGVADAIRWRGSALQDHPEQQSSVRETPLPPTSSPSNPFAWMANRAIVSHVIPLLSPEYIREFEGWNPLLIAFGLDSRSLEDLLYLPSGHNPHVTPVLLTPGRSTDSAEVPATLRANLSMPRWARPMEVSDDSFLQRIVDWATDPNRRAEGRVLSLDGAPSAGPGITTDPRILNDEGRLTERLETVKKALDIGNTTGSALKWWAAFESENTTRRKLVLRLAEELLLRKATITEFFLAYVYSNTDNIQANLHYLDYTRLKKEEEKLKKAKAENRRREESAQAAKAAHVSPGESRPDPSRASQPPDAAPAGPVSATLAAPAVTPTADALASGVRAAAATGDGASGASPLEADPPAYIRCPHCRSLVPHVASRCRMCGGTLP